MPRHAVGLVLLTLVWGCARQTDDARPVAAPTVTVARAGAVVGAPVELTYRFAVHDDAPPFVRDYTVFVHFLDADGSLLWVDDHAPPTPTSTWRPGAVIEYSRTTFVPKVPYVGQVSVLGGLYDPATGERLPLSAPTEGMRAYRLAAFPLALSNNPTFVVFREGWYDTEMPEDDSGLDWQWSRRRAVLAFRNPRRDATFYLLLDQPVDAFGEPQMVEVEVNGAVVDRFRAVPRQRQVRRLDLGAGQLGEGDSVEVVLTVDRTFVPATVPDLRSSDHRELGIRVFRAFVEPK